MANTYVDYTATAAQTDFAFSFPYLEDSHVTVEIDGVATTDFTIVTSPAKKIVLDTPATGGEIVRVIRKSQPDTNLVDFQNGSVLTESELDRAYLHNRYLNEESAEQNDDSLRLKAGAAGWEGLNKKILNIVDPTSDQDAATKNYVDETVAGVALGTVPDGSITAAKLDTDAVTTAKIEDGAVTAAKLDTNSVTNVKIEDNAVTAAKISATDSTFSIDGSGNMGLGIAANSAAKLYISGTGGNTFLAVKSDTMAAVDLEDSGASVDQKHYQMVSLDGAFEVRQINDDLTLKATPLKIDTSGNIDASGVYKVGGNNLLLDEDSMTSNSDTQGATQQSIKAYVDSQSSGLTVFAKGFIDTSNSVSRSTNITSSSYSSSDFTITFTSGAASPHATHIVQVTPRVTSTASLANYTCQYVWNSATELKVTVSGVANLDGISLVIFE